MRNIFVMTCLLFGLMNQFFCQTEKIKRDPGIHEYIFVEHEPGLLNFYEIRKKVGYPIKAIKAGIEGKVYLRVLVAPNGKIKQHVITRMAHPILNDAVSRYVGQLKFSPARLKSKAVAYWTNVRFNFSLAVDSRYSKKGKKPIANLGRKLLTSRKRATAFYELGLEAYQREDLDVAFDHFMLSIRRSPRGKKINDCTRLVESHYLIGKILITKKKWVQAVDEFTEAIAIARQTLKSCEEGDELIPRLYAKRALSLLQVGQASRALRDAQYLIKYYTEYQVEGHLFSGLALNRMGHHEKALAEIQEAIELAPSNPMAHYYKSIVLSEIGGMESAGESRNRARNLGLEW